MNYDEWELPNPIDPKSLFGVAAGIAWKRNGDFKKAEECYILALQSDSSAGASFYLESGLNCWHNLATCYEAWTGRGVMPSARVKLAISCGYAIIVTANIGTRTNISLPRGMKLCDVLKYKNKPAKAMKAMKQATSLEGVEAFCERIIEDGKPTFEGFGGCTIDDPEARKEALEKVAMEQLQTSNSVLGKIGGHCSCCGDIFYKKKLKSCPCLHAQYCSGECQKKHWKDHKLTHKVVMAKAAGPKKEEKREKKANEVKEAQKQKQGGFRAKEVQKKKQEEELRAMEEQARLLEEQMSMELAVESDEEEEDDLLTQLKREASVTNNF